MKRLIVLLAVAGCGQEAPTDPGSHPTRRTVGGDIVWSLDFDATAEDAGHVDCEYTQTYSGVEDASLPWLCPDCEQGSFRADVVLGGGDCYTQLTTMEPEPVEWLGWRDGALYRSVTSRLHRFADAVVDGDEVTVQSTGDYTAPRRGEYTETVSGVLELGYDDGEVARPWEPSPTRTCGTPVTDAPAYDGDYDLVIGEVLPDAILEDVCGDRVRLHDFTGAYTVLVAGWADCAPCRQAETQLVPDFLEQMDADGIDVGRLSLLSANTRPGLTPTATELRDYVDDLALEHPVLADRKYFVSVISPAMGDYTLAPVFVLLAPDLTVLATLSGGTSLDAFAQAIRSDVARR